MRAVDVIRRKRDGGELSDDEIRAFVAGATDGSWPDYQISALLMAIVWRGLSLDETVVLTNAMVSGRLDVPFRDCDGKCPQPSIPREQIDPSGRAAPICRSSR